MPRAIAFVVIVAALAFTGAAPVPGAHDRGVPGAFEVACSFDPPVLLPGESTVANITLANLLADPVLVQAVGIRLDWTPAHEHYYDICTTMPVELAPGAEGPFRATFAVPAGAAAANHTWHVCVEYRVNRSGELQNDTWMSDTFPGLDVVDFALSVEPARITLPAGRSAAVNVSVVAANGFDGVVELRAAPPAGTGGSLGLGFSPWNETRPGRPILLFVAAGPACPDRPYRITALGSFHGIRREAVLDVTVVPPPDFTLNVTPAKGRVMAGDHRSFMVTVAAHGNMTDTISLGARGLPAGCSAAFYPPSIRPGESARLELSAAQDAPADPRHEFTVDGRSGRWTAEQAVVVEVEPRPYTSGPLFWLALVILAAVAAAVWAATRRDRRAGRGSGP